MWLFTFHTHHNDVLESPPVFVHLQEWALFTCTLMPLLGIRPHGTSSLCRKINRKHNNSRNSQKTNYLNCMNGCCLVTAVTNDDDQKQVVQTCQGEKIKHQTQNCVQSNEATGFLDEGMRGANLPHNLGAIECHGNEEREGHRADFAVQRKQRFR